MWKSLALLRETEDDNENRQMFEYSERVFTLE